MEPLNLAMGLIGRRAKSKASRRCQRPNVQATQAGTQSPLFTFAARADHGWLTPGIDRGGIMKSRTMVAVAAAVAAGSLSWGALAQRSRGLPAAARQAAARKAAAADRSALPRDRK